MLEGFWGVSSKGGDENVSRRNELGVEFLDRRELQDLPLTLLMPAGGSGAITAPANLLRLLNSLFLYFLFFFPLVCCDWISVPSIKWHFLIYFLSTYFVT